jgi:hypothetical protein
MTVKYNLTVANLGSSGDVIDIEASSSRGWVVGLYMSDGTPMTDTEVPGDGIPDIGTLPSLSSINISVRVLIPGTEPGGVTDTTTVWANSSNTIGKDSATVNTVVVKGMEYRLPNRYATFVRGTLSVYGERDNTDVEIRNLVDGSILHSFNIDKGEEWSTSMMNAHININSTYNVTVLSGNSVNVTMGGAWMSYIPSHNGLKVGNNFTGFSASEMFIFVPRNATMPPTWIEIIDLPLNDGDVDDSKIITSASPELEFIIPDMVEIYNLSRDMDDFDDDVVHVNSNLKISVLAGKNSANHAWTMTPPSVDGSDIEVGTHFYTLASDSLTIFPTRDNTNIQLIDLTKNLDDDSITLNLDRNEFYTQRMNAYLGNLIQVRPWYTMFHNSNNIIDHDYIEVIADKNIIVYVGPIADDTFEFADLSPSVPTGSFSQEVYTYAQNGGANDLQLFVYDKNNTVINITSMTASRGALNFYDFVLDADDFSGVGPYWWAWGGWNGNLLHIQSNLPINVFNGDFDGASFGTYLATVEPPPEFKFPDLTISSSDITFTPKRDCAEHRRDRGHEHQCLFLRRSSVTINIHRQRDDTLASGTRKRLCRGAVDCLASGLAQYHRRRRP